jgi:hypothetical protein
MEGEGGEMLFAAIADRTLLLLSVSNCSDVVVTCVLFGTVAELVSCVVVVVVVVTATTGKEVVVEMTWVRMLAIFMPMASS